MIVPAVLVISCGVLAAATILLGLYCWSLRTELQDARALLYKLRTACALSSAKPVDQQEAPSAPPAIPGRFPFQHRIRSLCNLKWVFEVYHGEEWKAARLWCGGPKFIRQGDSDYHECFCDRETAADALRAQIMARYGVGIDEYQAEVERTREKKQDA
jgi:hypothetical protein